jgi:F-type H+-transporting ATPase subunit c
VRRVCCIFFYPISKLKALILTAPQTGRIFISYRRDDSAGYAGRIYDRLVAHFGEDALFMDVDAIEAGLDFVEVLENAVQSDPGNHPIIITTLKEDSMAIEGVDIIKAAAFLGAGLAMGLGAIGPGVGEGMVAAKACEAIGKNPKEAGLLTRTMLVGQAVSESTGIYSLVIALLLLFVV